MLEQSQIGSVKNTSLIGVMSSTANTIHRLPRSIINLTLVASFAPLALMLLGVDLSSAMPQVTIDALQGLTGGEFADAIHHSLRGSYIHTLLEWSALCVALFTVGLAFVHYRIVKDVTTPLIAMALLASGAMDAFHTLAADRLIETVADNQNLIPFTWAICRVFNALILMIGVGLLLWRKRERINVKSTSNFLLITSVAFMGLAYAVIHYSAVSANLPQTQFPDSFITRPWDLVPLVLFIISGLFLYPKFYKSNRSVFAHALLIGAIPEIMTQVHMTFGSSSLFDSNFNAAHYLKVVSYLVPMAGLLYDYVNTYKVKEEIVVQLEDEIMERRASREKLLRVSRELRESEEESAQRTAYLEGVFNSSNSGMILTTNTDGVIIMMSSGSEGLLGFGSSDVCGKMNIVDFLHFESAVENERWVTLTALARVGLTDRAERQIVTRSGQLIPTDLSISAVFISSKGDQELTGFLFNGLDIRESKEREALVVSAGQEAEKAQNEALIAAEESERQRQLLEEAMAQVEMAEMELNTSRKRIEEVTSTINEAIWSMDAETQAFTYLSEACEVIFGFLPSDYIVRPDLLEDAIHAEDKEIYFGSLDALGRGQRVDFEFRVIDANGVTKWIKAIASPIEFVGDRATRFSGSFSDITELHEATDALLESEAKVRAILENVGDGIVTLDSSGRIQMSNPAMLALFGYSSEEFSQKHITEIIPLVNTDSSERSTLDIDTIDFMQQALRCSLESEDCELLAKHSDGRKFPVEIAFNEFRLVDSQFYIAVIRDITELNAQKEFFAQAEKNTAISALAAGVAHEFKNCLGGIMGNATLALDYPGEEKLVSESLDEIVKISDKANRIALSLLSYAQTEEISEAICSANSVLQEVKILLDNECREKNVRLKMDIDQDLVVTVDSANLQQAIINISLNAIQASESGGVVQVRGFKEKDMIILEVRDSGCGMTDEVVKRAFDPFFSSKGVWGDDAAVGQGLGLTTAKNMIQKSGGSIELRSRRGSGTTVEIRLPIGQEDVGREEVQKYASAEELPEILLHRFTSSSLSSVAEFLDELQVNWNSVSHIEDLTENLSAKVGIIILDGMSPSKIDFARMFDIVREQRPDIRVVVSVESVYDYYVTDYVNGADCVLKSPITKSGLCQALDLANPSITTASAIT